MQAKGMPPGDAAFKEIVADRVLIVLRRLVKRGSWQSTAQVVTPNGR
jgi:hypothetical protein